MVQYRRNRIAGGTYFLTVTLRDRRSTLLMDHVADLRTAFKATRRRLPFTLEAVCILPDHFHAVLSLPPEDEDYSQRIRLIKSGFTRALRTRGVALERDRRGEYHLWQRRFWEHTIRDARDLEAHVDYVHYNPVKHGLVKSVAGWPYSSFHRYVRLGWLSLDWAGGALPEGDFGEP